MKNISRERVAEAISRAESKMRELNLNIKDQKEFLQKRDSIIESVIISHLRIHKKEVIFELIKESIIKSIKMSPND